MTRTGGVVKRSLGAASSTTLTTYTVNEVLDTVRIRYAQKDRLETYGVWPDDDSDEVSELGPPDSDDGWD